MFQTVWAWYTHFSDDLFTNTGDYMSTILDAYLKIYGCLIKIQNNLQELGPLKFFKSALSIDEAITRNNWVKN